MTYNGNGSTGGSVPVDSTNYEAGAMVTVADNTGNLIKIPPAGTGEAFKFGGWNTQADGNGTNYTAGSGTFVITSNTTLYAKWIPYALRDVGPAGGLIFYDKGSYSAGWRYLEAAPSDQGTGGIQWYNGSYTATGATATAVGTGQANTTMIVTSQGAGSYAAQLCNDLSIGSYSDWFLPSKDELGFMYTNLKEYGVGGFPAAYYYWSSSEDGTNLAWAQAFATGGWNNVYKYYNNRVRAARAF
ncbi:MAG: InlB B-repeat-containing protein [Chloroflexota bacterium]